MGDINIGLLKYDIHCPTSDYVNDLLTKAFLPTILMPTRITNTTATLIDHVYYFEGTNCKRECKGMSGNIITDITDHFANYFILCHEKTKQAKEKRSYVRFFTKNNKILFKHQMDEIDCDKKVYSAPDFDTAYNNFISEIQAVCNSSFPPTQLSIN